METIISAFKARAKFFADAAANRGNPIKQGTLTIPKEKRLRNKLHLRFVSSKPCLVCGRQPSHAHHVRYAQERGLGMKVSDEYTVPLCSVHHDELHRVGNEKIWWANHGIDPLKVADELWAFTLKGEQIEASGPDRISNNLDLTIPALLAGMRAQNREINSPCFLEAQREPRAVARRARLRSSVVCGTFLIDNRRW
jgi:hypothetical protein